MNILILANEYPYEKYPKKNSPWTIPFFAREWVKQGHNVVAIVDSTKFLKPFYFGAKIFRRFFEKKYNMVADDISNRSWAKPFEFNDNGVIVFNKPMFKFLPSTNFSKRVINKQCKSIIDQLKNINFVPDLITGHWINPQLILISKLKKHFCCKTSFVFESDYRSGFLKKYKVGDYINDIDKVGCRSKFAKEQLAKNLNLHSEVFICYSGIPTIFTSNIQNKYFDNDVINICSVGRLVKLKRFDALLDACKNAYANINYSVKIAGEGGEKANLEQVIQQNNQTKKAVLCGKLDRNSLIKFYDNADIFVLISEHEAFGIVYLEALSRGCIVVASRNGGIDGVIEDGYNGYLCDEGNAKELASILEKIADLPIETKKTISERAIETAKRFTDDKVAKMYLESAIN